MIEWVLVLVVAWREPALVTVPWRFATEVNCQEAGEAWAGALKKKNGYFGFYTCLPYKVSRL